MKKIRPWKPRIKCVSGMWRATAPNGSHDARRALIPAITFCRRLNATRQEGAALDSAVLIALGFKRDEDLG